MPSFWTDRTGFPYSNDVYPALTSVTDEVCAAVARIFAYVGTLALFGIVGIHLWGQYQAEAGTAAKIGSEAVSKTGWAMGRTGGWKVSDRSRPAFAVSQFDASDKSAAYTILRHPDGGRKDVLRWTDAAEKPVAELEIYRPGRESDASSPAAAEIAARMLQIDASGVEAAGIVESKLGTVALLRPVERSEATGRAEACLAFFKRIDEPHLQIAGWSCQGDNGPARRAAIGCMLSRLTLLTSGNEPKLAGLFARAELKRGNCAAAPGDWVTGVEDPKLRGTL
jgi:hypothetical protein